MWLAIGISNLAMGTRIWKLDKVKDTEYDELMTFLLYQQLVILLL